MLTTTIASLALLALDPDLAVSQYAKKHWQVEDGLPQNYVTWLSQTREGYLLVGTSGGVARFDGLRFTPIVLDPKTGVTREWINAAQPGADGTLWIASRDAGLFRFGASLIDARWTSTAISSLIPLRDGRMLSLGQSGLQVWAGGDSRTIRADMRAANPSWQGLLEDADGSLLIASATGAWRVNPATGEAALILDTRREATLSVGSAAAGSGFWLGTSLGLYRGSSKGLVKIAGVPGPVVTVIEDRDGNVWAATWGHGLYRISKAAGKAERCNDGVADDFVHSLFEDREGNLWIGSRAGLSRWSSGPMTPYGPEEGLPGKFFSSAVGDANGRMWFGTWRSGLYEREAQGLIRKIALPSPDLNVLVRAMAFAPDGSLWLSDWNGLQRYDGDSRWTRAAELGAEAAEAHALAFDAQGRLWLGSSHGLYMHPDVRALRSGSPAVISERVQSLFAASDAVWAGTEKGLWRIPAQGPPAAIAGLPHPSVVSVQADSRGRIWCTTKANGIVLVANGKVEAVFDQSHGLPPQPFYAVLDDGRGSLWLSSPAGIYEVPIAGIDAVLARRAPALTTVAYDQEDGMRSIECQNVGRPAAWKDSSGDLWFPTVRGMVRIRPSAKRMLPPPAVVIEAVESGAQGHSVRYTSTQLSAPSHLEFRYRIDGQDWISTGAAREFRYNGLTAGRHRLQIAARLVGGEWSSEPASAELVQLPRWYETWWFRTLAVAAFAAMLWAIYLWRMLILRGRYRAVLLERNRIASEWHDTLVAGFSAISWQLDTALKRVGGGQPAETTIATARTMVHHYRAEARRVIWDLRQNEPEIESLPQAMERALTELTRDRGVHSQLLVEGDAATLAAGDMSQNLLRICQEAVSNAIQHAGASKILVLLRFDRNQVLARVEDDGAGFQPAEVPAGHFGLTIMRERARRFGGELQIHSNPGGGGTVITASLPYANGSA